MGAIKFTATLTVKDNLNKPVDVHEYQCSAEYTPNGDGFDVDFSVLNEDGSINIFASSITLAMDEAYQYQGFASVIDGLIWDDIKEEKISSAGLEYEAAQGWR